MMYKLMKPIFAVIRIVVSYITIEQIQFVTDDIFNYFISGAVITVLLVLFRIFAYTAIGKLSERLFINSAIFKSFLYTVIYLLFVLLVFGILKLLSHFGMLPIHTVTFEQIFENYFNKIMNKIADTLIPSTAVI